MRSFIIQAAGALTLAAALLLAPLQAVADASTGRLYTIDDLLDQAAFGNVTIDPTDRWVVFEQAGPYSASPRFDYGLYLRAASNILWIADTRSDRAPERLLPESEGAGHVLGDWSPSGRRLLVYRLQDDQWRLGVVEMATRAVRWLDARPEAGGFGRVAQWVSDDELVLIDRRDDDLPYVVAWDAEAMALTRQRWAAQASGSVPSGTLMGAGRFSGDTPISPDNDLVHLDLRTGARTVLSTGRFVDLELSPDRRRVAAMTQGVLPPVDQSRPLWPVDKPERRHVEIVDLERATVTRPCGGCAVAPHLMGWSPDSRRVLVWMIGPNGPTSGELAALGADGRAQTYDRFGLEPDVAATQVASFTTVRALWQGDRPVLRGRRGSDGRYDWYRLERDRPVNLSAVFTKPPSRISASEGDDLFAIADGVAWRLGRDGRATALTPPGELTPFAPFDILDAPRHWYNTPDAGPRLLAAEASGQLTPVGAAWAPPPAEDPGLLVTAIAGNSDHVVEETVRNGVHALVLRGRDGRQRTLATLNAYLAEVAFARPVAVHHTGPDGEALTSWLYLPPRPSAGPIPLVVLTYPGIPARAQRDPAEFVTELNFQQLTAAGYAVLTPTVPRPFFPAEPAKGLADQILSVVDATLAQHPELDGDRLVYWGQSFGGYSGLVVATQTTRFKSIIVQAVISNLAHKWGEFAPWNRADPRWGVSMRHDAGWAEASQGGMGGPPWSDPERYTRNSPLFQADRIQTPILVMQGERDMGVGQAEALYAALWRQNKDVRFMTWWGEGHTVESAANLREMYRQILDWLALTAPPSAGPTFIGAGRPTGEASSPPAPPR